MEIVKANRMEIMKKRAKFWMLISLALLLISMVFTNLIMTNFGSVTIKDIRYESSLGIQISGLLFIPKNASATNKLPTVVTSHGMYNNREMQDVNFTELARRGYIVFAHDMPNMGNTDISKVSFANGMYESVKMLAGINFVDATKIGITGHSAGGMSCTTALNLDNAAPKQLIAAIIYNASDATFKNGTAWANIYGSRDVGVIMCQYDEFFGRTTVNGVTLPTREYINQENAQSFLNFGVDPKGKPKRNAETIYHQTINGVDAIRVVYMPEQDHPWSHFSARSAKATIEFYQASLGAPNNIASTDQVWQWKEAFNFVGIIGFAMFAVCLTCLLVFSKSFASLRAAEPVKIREAKGAGIIWFWGLLVAGSLFSGLIYGTVATGKYTFGTAGGTWPAQTESIQIAMWAAACGVFALLTMAIFYVAYGKKHGVDLRERGIIMPWKQVFKTLLLAAIIIAATYSTVFVADYFFKTDFRLWTLAIKTFNPQFIGIAFSPYVFLFVIFYVANSMAINCFNFVKITKSEKEPEWINTALLAFMNIAPLIYLIWTQYASFWKTGFVLYSYSMQILWLFPMLVILTGTAVMSRKIYKITNNPYLPGIINGVIITLMTVTNTTTTPV